MKRVKQAETIAGINVTMKVKKLNGGVSTYSSIYKEKKKLEHSLFCDIG